MTIKVSDAKKTALIIQEKIKSLELIMNEQKGDENPIVQKMYVQNEARVETLKDVLAALNGDFIMLNIFTRV